MYTLLDLAIVSFLLSFLLTPLVRNFCRRFGLIDQPGGRKLHRYPVPRAGGIAIVLAFGGAYAITLLTGLDGVRIIWAARNEIWRMLPAAAAIFVIGLIDDLYGLKPSTKFLGGIGAALLAYLAGVQLTAMGGHSMPHWASLPLTVAWLLLCTNAVNLIDGIDGLAVGLGLCACLTMAISALMQGDITLALAVVPLAGALLGFLPYNFNPATVFLGDCGSLFIGFILGCYSIRWNQKSATVLSMTAPLMALAIPLLDASLAVLRRFVQNKPIFAADRGHIHHRLLDLGMTPQNATLALYSSSAIGAICALGMKYTKVSGVTALIVFLAVFWIGVQQLGYVEFGAVHRMFMFGAFRRHLSSQVIIASFEERLKTATTAEQCWDIIRTTCNDFGLHSVSLRLAGQVFEYSHGPDPDNAWTLRIPLSAGDFIEIAREFGHNDHSAVISVFAESIRKNLTPKIALMDREIAPKAVTNYR